MTTNTQEAESGGFEPLDTKEKYKAAFYEMVGQLADVGNGEVTTEDVCDHIGMPPHSPFAVGSLMTGAARYHGLVKIGSRQVANRHQNLVTIWSKPKGREWTPKIVPRPI